MAETGKKIEKKLNQTLTNSMHGIVFTNIYRKRCHTSDIELQIVHAVWLKYDSEHQS